MKISKDEVLHVARLARLNIEGEAVDRFAGQLGGILEYVESLAEIDTTDVDPTSHAVAAKNAFRQDEPHAHLDQAAATANAPESEDGCFIVPKVIE